MFCKIPKGPEIKQSSLQYIIGTRECYSSETSGNEEYPKRIECRACIGQHDLYIVSVYKLY